jgi:ligand-binding sensor domain-containing protein/signal transduction histidine kinase
MASGFEWTHSRSTCCLQFAGRQAPPKIRHLYLLAVWVFGCSAVSALEPSTPLANFARQSWAIESGLPQNSVQALLQSKAGYLWLGTEAGLARFDGNAFQVYDRNSRPALPGSDVRCLLEAHDGTLWIGTSEGLARWKDETVTAFTTRDGLPANGIRALAESPDSVLFAWTDLGLARREGERFVQVTSLDSFPPDSLPVQGEFPGAPVFETQLPGGRSVVGSRRSLDLLQGGKLAPVAIHLTVGKELPGSRIQTVFPDREGALWIGTNAGLVRVEAGKVERFSLADALATASILSLLEDREGDLWVGTENDGLHILRDQRFRTLGAHEGLSSDATTAVVEDAKGALWIGTPQDGLYALRTSGADAPTRPVRIWTVRTGLASDVILSLAAAPNGDLWVGTPDGLNRIHAGTIKTFTSADGLPDDFIRSLLIDADGSLWIGTRRGLAHWISKNGALENLSALAQMETFTHENGLGSDLVGAMARDAHGDLWVATLQGLSRLHNAKIENFTVANGLSSNVITALSARRDGTLLIGTQDHGWDVWDGHGFSAVMARELDQTSIHAILDDGIGHLWFATGDGIARCDCNATNRAGSVQMCTHWMRFSTADGLHSLETATNSHPSAWRSRDGRLWFATPKGLVVVDPAHFPVNTLPPPVAIERFAVDDVEQALHAADPWLKVSAGHVHFQFDYAGLSYVAPQKVRYRYMLEGFDRGWSDAGARRAAYYTNIPPGRYTFRVQAANNDGVWNSTGAAIQFELAPHFYQMLWFYVLWLTALAAGIVLLVQRRLRAVEHEFKAVLGERSRIAREIHDTLAQGYAGISLQLEVLSEFLRRSKLDDAEKQLNETREIVREGLAEARQSIWSLRTQDAAESTLPVRLRRMVESAGDESLVANFELFGAYRALPAATERELLRVAQEAMHNVRKHAGAKQLLVRLEYGAGQIALEVRDDGRGGVDPEAGAEAGHFGITGMRERAAAIRGTLEITSEPGMGTTVRLRALAPIQTRLQSGEPR